MKKTKKLFAILTMGAIVLTIVFVVQNAVFAEGMSTVSVVLHGTDGMNISDADADVSATIVSFTPTAEINTDDGIQINFESDFDIASVVNDDVTVGQANGGTDITKGTAAVSGQNLQIPITTEGDNPDGAVTVSLSNSHVHTPTTPGTYTVTITTWDLGDDGAFGGAGADADTLEDNGAAAVVIGTNQVEITGNVDPTLTLTLSGNTCALGTLSATNIKTCNYSTTVGTNAASGYSAKIKADGGLRNGATSITDVSDDNVTPGSEEYGVSTTMSGETIDQINDADENALYQQADCTHMNDQAVHAMTAHPLNTGDQDFANSSGPVSSSVAYLCHAAGITGTTPAGTYTQLVTITVIGNF